MAVDQGQPPGQQVGGATDGQFDSHHNRAQCIISLPGALHTNEVPDIFLPP